MATAVLPSDAMIGQTFKHYEVEAELGKGGMGVVYRARDTQLGRPVALKVLTPEFTRDEDRKKRFLQEARAASAVNHPAIAPVYEVGEGPEGLFIAMELVEGRTVKALIQARELDLLGGIEVALQVAGGLQKAHEAGIVHRDIKPENVVVTPDGHAKILDFGLAKLLEPTAPATARSADEISHMETLAKTQAGFVLGTLRYMSPEQARGQAIDYRSDIFSLGVVLYEMVTGQLPFSGSTPLDTLHAIAYEETRPVTALRPNIPASLQRVVTRCLRKRAADRYPDARELITDLKAVQREVESGISSKVPLGVRLQEQWTSLRHRTLGEWLLPAGVGVVLLAVVLAMLFGPETEGLPGSLIFFGIVGLFVWRRFRNRRIRLARRAVKKMSRMEEVRLIALDGMRLTVLADRAQARTYVRANAIVDAVNSSMFFGDPFTVVVRDDVSDEEAKALLTGPGILYVRENEPLPPAPPAPNTTSVEQG
ncbi:MAG: serine/threonine protein kinase [Acidobacteria bacterium]|jgi:predicted Ser/Thr protein kinase|nr:serine/threonine protein kinase [Acidobacteriota bacterium]